GKDEIIQTYVDSRQVSVSSTVIHAGNLQAANLRQALLQKAWAKDKGILQDVTDCAFDDNMSMPVYDCLECARPLGVLGFEVDFAGGESRASKLGKPGPVSHWIAAEQHVALAQILQSGYKIYDNIAPPGIPIGSHIWLVNIPTKVKNGEEYDIGGTPLYTYHNPKFPYEDPSAPSERSADKFHFYFTDNKRDNTPYMWIRQWRVFSTLDPGFDPSDVCPIDWDQPEYRDALEKENKVEIPHHNGYYQHLGILI